MVASGASQQDTAVTKEKCMETVAGSEEERQASLAHSGEGINLRSTMRKKRVLRQVFLPLEPRRLKRHQQKRKNRYRIFSNLAKTSRQLQATERRPAAFWTTSALPRAVQLRLTMISMTFSQQPHPRWHIHQLLGLDRSLHLQPLQQPLPQLNSLHHSR